MTDSPAEGNQVAPEAQPSSVSQPEQGSTPEAQPYSAENDPTLNEEPVAGSEENAPEVKVEEDITKLSPRAQQRFQTLANKVRDLQSGAGVSQDPPQAPTLPEFNYQPGQEIGVKDLQRDLTSAARGIVQLELERERNIGRIANETIEVEYKYPELNPDLPQFNKKLTENISRIVEREIQRNPSASVSGIVSEIMAIRDEGRRQGTEAGVASTVQKMGKQAVTPSGGRPAKKNFADLSIPEMEKRLGFTP